MNNNFDIISSAEMITGTFANIEKSKIEKNNKVLGAWKKTVSAIRYSGEKLASHSRLIDLKNGILLVETDHPGWTQLLQLNKKFIITGLKRLVPNLEITTLAFRLKGSSASLCDSNEAEKKEKIKLLQRLDKEESQLSKYKNDKGSEKNEEIPADLKHLLAHLHSDMLTNTKE